MEKNSELRTSTTNIQKNSILPLETLLFIAVNVNETITELFQQAQQIYVC